MQEVVVVVGLVLELLEFVIVVVVQCDLVFEVYWWYFLGVVLLVDGLVRLCDVVGVFNCGEFDMLWDLFLQVLFGSGVVEYWEVMVD